MFAIDANIALSFVGLLRSDQAFYQARNCPNGTRTSLVLCGSGVLPLIKINGTFVL